MAKLPQPVRWSILIPLIVFAIIAVTVSSWLFLEAHCLTVKKDAAKPAPPPPFHKSSLGTPNPRDKPAPSRYPAARGSPFLEHYSSTALILRTPDEEDSSFLILNFPSSPVRKAWGPPQISRDTTLSSNPTV